MTAPRASSWRLRIGRTGTTGRGLRPPTGEQSGQGENLDALGASPGTSVRSGPPGVANVLGSAWPLSSKTTGSRASKNCNCASASCGDAAGVFRGGFSPATGAASRPWRLSYLCDESGSTQVRRTAFAEPNSTATEPARRNARRSTYGRERAGVAGRLDRPAPDPHRIGELHLSERAGKPGRGSTPGCAFPVAPAVVVMVDRPQQLVSRHKRGVMAPRPNVRPAGQARCAWSICEIRIQCRARRRLANRGES